MLGHATMGKLQGNMARFPAISLPFPELKLEWQMATYEYK